MKKYGFLLILLVIQLNVKAINVKEVKLIYSKNEVYPGNTFKVKLKIISTKNIAYFSDESKKADFINLKGEVLIHNQNGCDSILTFKIELKDNPKIYTTNQTPININNNRLEFNKRTLSKYIDNLNYLDEIDLYVDIISLDCSKDSLIKITFKSKDAYIYKSVYLPVKNGLLVLDLQGKDGRDGKNGENGVYLSKNGKDGADRKNGEDGMNVIIFYSENSKQYLSRLVIYNQGGTGGKGGKGDLGISYYINTTDDKKEITYAPNGRTGRNGIDGRSGSVKICNDRVKSLPTYSCHCSVFH